MQGDAPIILYVDDEHPNRVVFEQSFNDRFSILTADSGEQALVLLAEHDVSVLVTDQRMRGMSGNALLMRAKDLFPDVIRVVVTAYGDLEPILRAVNDGLVARYIIKPWDARELGKALGWCVEAHQLGRRNSAIQLRLLETERLATLGSILSGIVHDMNQPLSYVLMGAERLGKLGGVADALAEFAEQHRGDIPLAQRKGIAMLLDELPDLADDIAHGARLMRNMVDSLQAASRKAGSSVVEDRAEPVAVIDYAMTVCRQVILRSDGAIRYDGPQALPQVGVTTTKLTQVLINLITNASHAVQARDESGGRVLIEARLVNSAAKPEQAVEPGNEPAAEHVGFVVSDNGNGMSAETLAKIGTPFFTTKESGSGLGLLQCRRIIEGVGGTLELRSEVGAGTTATFSLPVALPTR